MRVISLDWSLFLFKWLLVIDFLASFLYILVTTTNMFVVLQEEKVDSSLEFLILASDGLWDVVTNEVCNDFHFFHFPLDTFVILCIFVINHKNINESGRVKNCWVACLTFSGAYENPPKLFHVKNYHINLETRDQSCLY